MATIRLLTCLLGVALILMGHMLAASPLQRRAGVVPSLSGGPAIMGAGTYPRANFLQDGSIIGAFTAFPDGNNAIVVVHSTDGGVTWNQIGTVATGDSATHDIDNPYVLQLPSGRVLAAFRNHDRTAPTTYTFFRITVCYSDDGGATWTYLSTPASDPGPTNGNWEPFLRSAQDGSLQIYYSRENSAADQDSLMRTSTDGGMTWSDATTISGGELTSTRDGMLGVTTVSGSNLIAVFETETNGGQFTIGSVTSPDDGNTWGNRQTVYTPTSANANANAPQVINVGGTLVASFQTNEDEPGNDDGTDAKVLTSGDGGATWGNKLTFSNIESHWPGLLDIDGGSLLGLADDGGAKAQKITIG
ncbi:glycoside hydrolase family 93 protein [Viridothelium virens]|uniref:Glycoside hydrolase family 93 protein n=1 Tax=Viridothelium virens TaxID=1048519 RepID=A0A6A6GTB0_VIRVR|nr:glycoside hydrolase family 93 protein [Viridothelium virens]